MYFDADDGEEEHAALQEVQAAAVRPSRDPGGLHRCRSCYRVLSLLQLHLLIETCRYICFRNVVDVEWNRIWTFENLLSRYVQRRRPNRAL